MLLKKVDNLIGPLLANVLSVNPGTDENVDGISRVLIIRPGGIGDAVLLVPMVQSLRNLWPDLYIEILAEKRNAGVFVMVPAVDRVRCYDNPCQFVKIWGEKYDVVIDSEQSYFLSAVVARLVRSRIKVGFGTNDRRKLFTHTVEYDQKTYEANCFLSLLTPIGINLSPSVINRSLLEIPEGDQKKADFLLEPILQDSILVIFPGASVKEKQWGLEKFRQLAVKAISSGLKVVVVGGDSEALRGDAVVDGLEGLNLAGKTSLSETAGILRRSKVLVSGDSGVLHIAAGLGVPTVSLFGASSASKWAPKGESHWVVDHALECSPCSRFAKVSECQIGTKCLRDISVDEVFAAIEKLLVERD